MTEANRKKERKTGAIKTFRREYVAGLLVSREKK